MEMTDKETTIPLPKEEVAAAAPPKDAHSCGALPHWHAPQPEQVTFPPPGLRLYNSLTRQKELLATMNGSKQLTWYMYVSSMAMACSFDRL
jgi:hypothetical protein